MCRGVLPFWVLWGLRMGVRCVCLDGWACVLYMLGREIAIHIDACILSKYTPGAGVGPIGEQQAGDAGLSHPTGNVEGGAA